jgi:hypothetical protein
MKNIIVQIEKKDQFKVGFLTRIGLSSKTVSVKAYLFEDV